MHSTYSLMSPWHRRNRKQLITTIAIRRLPVNVRRIPVANLELIRAPMLLPLHDG